MTIGAVFACAYRRDIVRQSRNAVAKRSRNQAQGPVSTVPKREMASIANEKPKPPPKDEGIWDVDVSVKPPPTCLNNKEPILTTTPHWCAGEVWPLVPRALVESRRYGRIPATLSMIRDKLHFRALLSTSMHPRKYKGNNIWS